MKKRKRAVIKIMAQEGPCTIVQPNGQRLTLPKGAHCTIGVPPDKMAGIVGGAIIPEDMRGDIAYMERYGCFPGKGEE